VGWMAVSCRLVGGGIVRAGGWDSAGGSVV
jgi:hypothetical protein